MSAAPEPPPTDNDLALVIQRAIDTGYRHHGVRKKVLALLEGCAVNVPRSQFERRPDDYTALYLIVRG